MKDSISHSATVIASLTVPLLPSGSPSRVLHHASVAINGRTSVHHRLLRPQNQSSPPSPISPPMSSLAFPCVSPHVPSSSLSTPSLLFFYLSPRCPTAAHLLHRHHHRLVVVPIVLRRSRAALRDPRATANLVRTSLLLEHPCFAISTVRPSCCSAIVSPRR